MDWPREFREVRGFELPLAREGFGAALQRGQGRAVLQAKRFGGACDQDLIVDACVHHQAYDPQCEGDRSAWVMGIVEATGLGDVVCAAVVGALGKLGEDEGYWDVQQACGLARMFAERGRSAAREALYGAFRKLRHSADYVGAEHIIALDGENGVVWIADRLGSEGAVEAQGIFWSYDAEHGEGAALEVLRRAAAQNKRVAGFVAATGAADKTKGDEGHIDPRNVRLGGSQRPRLTSGAEVIERIRAEGPDENSLWPTGAGARLTEEGRAQVAAAMFGEAEPGRLRKYLRALRLRGLKTFDGRLIELARHADVGVREGAFAVLAHFEHPQVRALAVACAERREFGEGQIRLFGRNFGVGDGALLERTLVFPSNVHTFHTIIRDLANSFSGIGAAEVDGILGFVYEYSPCGNCREGAARGLARRGAMPAWMREECRFDVVEALRNLSE